AVEFFGVGRGAQRWLDLGLLRFQPSEAMKLALPLALAAMLARASLPPDWRTVLASVALIAAPVALVAIQPGLGTAVMVGVSGGCVLFLAGLSWRLIVGLFAALAAAATLVWINMHEYQQDRIRTFLDPETDP